MRATSSDSSFVILAEKFRIADSGQARPIERAKAESELIVAGYWRCSLQRFFRGGLSLFLVTWLAACGSSPGVHRSNLAPPTERNVIGPGDTFTLEIVGEKDLPHDYQVASDGTVDLPYVHTLHVADLEAQEVARLVREHLISEKVLTDPSVVVQVKEYASRHVTLLGQVAKPGSFPLIPGMSLIQAHIGLDDHSSALGRLAERLSKHV